MDFSLTGVAAALSNPLAVADIPLLLLATDDTDYLFVRHEYFASACEALTGAGHLVFPTDAAQS